MGVGAALVVDLDCFLQVGVATSLWSFVEMI